MSPNGGQLKGSAYLTTLQFIDHRFGSPSRQRVFAKLTDEDRALVSGLILPIAWYPLPPFARLLRVMDRELGRGDLQLSTDRGVFAATSDLTTIHRLMTKFLSPGYLIKRAATFWSDYHDTGHWEIVPLTPTSARGDLHDHAILDEAFCATIKGWVLGLFGLAGCKDLRVEHTACRLRGAPVCSYLGTWR